MKAEDGSVFIIIVNWNGWEDTAACVDSCRSLDYDNAHVIVVDNGSTNGSAPRLRERFDQLEIIESRVNTGFAGGNNIGIKVALDRGAEFVWLLNNDTTVEAESLTSLVSALNADDSAGIAGSKTLFFDRPDVLWSAGGCISPRWGWTYHRGEGERDVGQYDLIEEVDYVPGASLLVRASVVERIGLMSEDYFLYWEETDWCERARTAGWHVLYVPRSRVWHKVGASMPKDRTHTTWRYEGRNRVLFYRRNRPGLVVRVSLLTLVNALYLLLRGRPRSAFALVRGLVDGLSGRSTGAYSPE